MSNFDYNVEVSIIIPFFKNKIWLKEALDSINLQIFKNFEVIIVNDGSHEEISDLFINYSFPISYNYQENKGPGEARNYGISKSSGRYITFLDSDDIWLPDKLEKQLHFMIEGKFKWSHTYYYNFLNENQYKIKKVRFSFSGNVIPQIFFRCPIATPCVMIEKSILDENPLLRFDPNMRAGEDFMFWLKLSNQYDLGLLKEYLTKVRLHNCNASKNPIIQISFRRNLYFKLNDYKDSFPSVLIFKLTKYNYALCNLYASLLDEFRNDNKELLARFLYIIPYTYFRICNLFYIKK